MFGDVGNGHAARTRLIQVIGGAGALGEYNGNLCATSTCCARFLPTSRSHIRRTYRNFFQPEKRWQFTGISWHASTMNR